IVRLSLHDRDPDFAAEIGLGGVWAFVPEDLRPLAELVARLRQPFGGDARPGALEGLREGADRGEDGPGSRRDGQHFPAPGVLAIGRHADPLVEHAAFVDAVYVVRRPDYPSRLEVR